MSETDVATRKCTNCSRGPQPMCEFVSAKDASVFVKRCAKCRAKDGESEFVELCSAVAKDENC